MDSEKNWTGSNKLFLARTHMIIWRIGAFTYNLYSSLYMRLLMKTQDFLNLNIL